MTFEGFVPPVDDYFRMPNEWINICSEIDSLAEMKIVQYVLRHTWGYQGFSGARKITIDEFMHGRKRKDGSRIDNGTGLSKQSVITAVGAAIVHGYLTCDRDDKDMARQKKYFQLAMKSGVKPLDTRTDVKNLDIQSGVQNLDIPDVKNLDPDVQIVDSYGQEFRHRSEKDTIERHFKKDTLERQGGNAPINLEVAKKKRETNPRMLALSVSSHSQRLSEKSDGEEEDEEPTVKVPSIKIGGNVDATDNIQHRGNTRPLLPHLPSHTRQVLASEYSPGAGTRSLAVTPPGDDQALTLASETPVQRSGIPPGNSPASPPMAMTARQIKAQNEKRAKELWTIIEDELHTTFTENQRKSHKDGITSLIADDLSDEVVRTGLQALNTFERRTFTVSKFYGWLPNLSAKAPIFLKKASNGHNRDMVEWKGRYMTVEEADELGFNGGFGAYL